MDTLAFQTPTGGMVTDPYQLEHSHAMQYTMLGLSLGTVVLLLFIVGNMLMHKSVVLPHSTTQTQGVIPRLMKDQQDLNNALKQYDSAGAADTTVKAGLDQNSRDAALFSQ
ncbi:MAG TPA: hypothetical protein VFQ63_00230 [Patescibacteria group bacterium]|nr:hypothetical protein [Patescibacteria group bacterium]